jgi:hypothetical protein
MNKFKESGKALRNNAKNLVLEYMSMESLCQKDADGIRLSELFRNCGFDWGEYQNATSSNQQYWMVALMRELEKEKKVERLKSKKWRLC